MLPLSCRRLALSLALALPPLVLGPGEGRCAFLGDTLKPFASVSEMYDSNVFRVRDSGQLLQLIGDDKLGDFTTTAEVGTGLHYAISKQELDLLVKRDFIRFSHYTQEDADQDEANGKLSLSLLDTWRLKLDGAYTSTPEPRTDFRTAEQNVRKSYLYGATAGYRMTSGFTLEAGFHKRKVNYSLPIFATNEYDADIYLGTLTYDFSPATQLYGRYEHEVRSYRAGVPVDGALLRRDNTADSFRVGFVRNVSPRTTFSGYLGYLNRRHSAFPERDFSGVIGGVEASYGLTYKTRLMVSGVRDIYEETYPDKAYSVNNTLGVGAEYQATEKVKGTLFERVTWKDYQEIPGLVAPKRADFVEELTAGMAWTPINRLSLSLDYIYSMRSSDDSTFDFTDHTVSATVAYRY